MAPRRADRKPQSAKRTDDLRPHVFDFALEHEDVLVRGAFQIAVAFQLLVAMKELRRFRELAALFVNHRLVVNRNRIGRALLLRLLEQLQRAVEITLRVLKATLREKPLILLRDLAVLLELALKCERELQSRDERFLDAIRIHLQIPIELRLRLGITPRARERQREVVKQRRVVRLHRRGFREVVVRERVLLQIEVVLSEDDGGRELVRSRRDCGGRRRRFLRGERHRNEEQNEQRVSHRQLPCRNPSMTVVSHIC